MTLKVAVSWGELIDKITILEIKRDRLRDPGQLAHVETELAALVAARDEALTAAARDDALSVAADIAAETEALRSINTALWEIEDDIRDHERRGDFGPRFIELARSVYITNDRRAAVKRQINDRLGSEIVEEKSYADYG
ncbi:MAG: DUF6165 family protein [Proteobacteria bacterium]|nr:DUF6165 family protein [Pseudomonadota bacterium]